MLKLNFHLNVKTLTFFLKKKKRLAFIKNERMIGSSPPYQKSYLTARILSFICGLYTLHLDTETVAELWALHKGKRK